MKQSYRTLFICTLTALCLQASSMHAMECRPDTLRLESKNRQEPASPPRQYADCQHSNDFALLIKSKLNAQLRDLLTNGGPKEKIKKLIAQGAYVNVEGSSISQQAVLITRTT